MAQSAAVPRYERILSSILVVLTIGIVAFAILIMWQMDAGSKSQGGRFYVAIGALVVFVVVGSQIEKFLYRLVPFDIGTTEPERRYALLVLILGGVAAAVLVGAAWLLP